MSCVVHLIVPWPEHQEPLSLCFCV